MSLNKKVVLDIPHGGEEIPEEIISHLHNEITEEDLELEKDHGSKEFYLNQQDIPDENKLFFNINKAIVDVNREIGNLSYMGIIKTVTSQYKTLYKQGQNGLPDEFKIYLIKKYAKPYIESLRKSIKKPETKLVLLCHTMDSVKSSNKIKSTRKRPLFSIANGGDKLGNPNPEKPYQISKEIMEYIKDEIEKYIFDLNLNDVLWNGEIVEINTPFSAKKSIDRIGAETLKEKKALMVEVNEGLIYNRNTSSIERPENIEVIQNIIQNLIESIIRKIY